MERSGCFSILGLQGSQGATGSVLVHASSPKSGCRWLPGWPSQGQPYLWNGTKVMDKLVSGELRCPSSKRPWCTTLHALLRAGWPSATWGSQCGAHIASIPQGEPCCPELMRPQEPMETGEGECGAALQGPGQHAGGDGSTWPAPVRPPGHSVSGVVRQA